MADRGSRIADSAPSGPSASEGEREWLMRRALAEAPNPDDAEDLVQEAYLRFARNYDPARTVRSTFLARCLRSAGVDRRRDLGRRAKIAPLPTPERAGGDEAGGDFSGEDGPGEFEAADLSRLAPDERAWFTIALAVLPPRLAEAMALHLEGCDGPEIAARSGITPETARNRLSRARAVLRPMLDDACE